MKVIIFDVDDTLYDQMAPFGQAYEKVFGGRYQIACGELYERCRKHGDDALILQQQGSMTMEEMWIYRIARAFQDYQSEISSEDALKFQSCYGKNQKHLELSGAVKKMLLRLRESAVVTGVLTNGQHRHQWAKINTLGLTEFIPAQHIFVSEEIGAAKPDIRAFTYVERSLGIAGEEIWIAGDSYPNDIIGAARAGWKTLWFNRRGLDIDSRAAVPDRCVGSEEEFCQAVLTLGSAE